MNLDGCVRDLSRNPVSNMDRKGYSARQVGNYGRDGDKDIIVGNRGGGRLDIQWRLLGSTVWVLERVNEDFRRQAYPHIHKTSLRYVPGDVYDDFWMKPACRNKGDNHPRKACDRVNLWSLSDPSCQPVVLRLHPRK
jgi:hypothetical protein